MRGSCRLGGLLGGRVVSLLGLGVGFGFGCAGGGVGGGGFLLC